MNFALTGSGAVLKLAKNHCARLVYDRVKNLKSYLSESSPGFEKFENPTEVPRASLNSVVNSQTFGIVVPNTFGITIPSVVVTTEVMVQNFINRLRSSTNRCITAIKVGYERT